MTLLTAINRAQRRLSLPVTSSIVADGQETQNLLWELANAEAEDVLKRDEFDWPLLTRTQSFTASLASLQSAPGKPTNFQRALAETFWNQTKDRKINGPLNAEEWALAQGQSVTSSIQQYAMFRYDGLHIFPAPSTADTIAYDYIINTPIQATGGGSYKTLFTADSDVYLLGDALLVLGVRWRYLADKGRDYAEAQKDYELALSAEYRAQRGAARVLSIAPEYDDDPGATLPLVPDTGFGA